MWRQAAFVRQFSSAVPGDCTEGKATSADPRHTLGPEAVVRGWAACPHGGREERLVIHILQRYMHRTLWGSQWKNP